MEIPFEHFEVMTKTRTITFIEGPQVHGWGQVSVSPLPQWVVSPAILDLYH